MSDPITIQPNRLSVRYSAGHSEEDLIKEVNVNKEEDNLTKPEDLKIDSENVFYNETFEEKTFCDYLVNVCRCSSWLCANLVSSVVLCFENFVDFIRTGKCNHRFCCDICGGSEDSQEDTNSTIKNSRLRELSETRDEQEISDRLSSNKVPDYKDENQKNSSDIEERSSETANNQNTTVG